MRKILVISLMLSALAIGQNDGLVKTYYPNGAIETEGNYTKGVRDGLWTFWYEEKSLKTLEKMVLLTPKTRVKTMAFGTLQKLLL
mgnify:CR=1 FL=1